MSSRHGVRTGILAEFPLAGLSSNFLCAATLRDGCRLLPRCRIHQK